MVKGKSKSKRARKQAKRARRADKKRRRQAKPKPSRTPRIGPNTPYGECTERLTPFGGLLALSKFLDLLEFQEVFHAHYRSPARRPKLGCYRMMLGLLLLLFVGFQRVGHITYVREDPLMCGLLGVDRLPAVSTFWRYLQSLWMVQSEALLQIMAALRERVWLLVGFHPRRVTVNIDTTVATVYGQIQGGRKGHNPKHRGKKGLRPVLCFIEETREYLCGKQRRGETITIDEVANQIRRFEKYLPPCVEHVQVRGDGEFIGWESVRACEELGFSFTFGNRRCAPPFPDDGWYQWGDYEYNECWYQPAGWGAACRFVAMRIEKDKRGDRQLALLEEENYVYRVFVTNLQLRPHNVIVRYDKRADVENSIGEAQREGILAIPSKKFQSNHAYFQIVMLAYNLWRWMKQLAGHHEQEVRASDPSKQGESPGPARGGIVDHTIRVARLKMLYLAAKIASHANRDRVLYSMHDSRASTFIPFLDYLDRRRREDRPWPSSAPSKRVS